MTVRGRRRRDLVFGVINMVLGTLVVSLARGPGGGGLGPAAVIGGLVVFAIGAYLTLKGRGLVAHSGSAEGRPAGSAGRSSGHGRRGSGRRSDVWFGGFSVLAGLFLAVTGWDSDYSRFGLSAPALGFLAIAGGSYFVLRGLRARRRRDPR